MPTEDLSGNDLESFSGFSCTNNSGYTGTVVTPSTSFDVRNELEAIRAIARNFGNTTPISNEVDGLRTIVRLMDASDGRTRMNEFDCLVAIVRAGGLP